MAFTVATTRERTGNLFALYRRAKKREKGGKKREGEGEKKRSGKTQPWNNKRGCIQWSKISNRSFTFLIFLALILNSKSVISLDALNIFFSITKHVGNSNTY